MKPFGRCAAFLLVAAMSTMGTAMFVSASEDIPGTYYSDQAATEQAAPAQEEAPVRHRSVQDYQEANDSIGVPKSRVEQSPSLRYDGAVIGDADGSYTMDLEDVLLEEEDVAAANTTADNVRIADSTDNTRSETQSAETTAAETADDAAGDETQTAVPIAENPSTGRAGSVLPCAVAALLFAGAIPVMRRKLK